MKNCAILLLLLSPLMAGVVKGQSKQPATPVNTLSKAEKAAGWRLLFDGTSLTGWRGFHSDQNAGNPIPGGWKVESGTLHKQAGRGTAEQPGGDLITVDQFGNFELSIEWQISKAGNSGIKYLVSESLPPTGRGAISFEYQVLDDDNHPDAKMGIAGNRTSGALYDLIAPAAAKRLRPVGQFNQTRIIVNGDKIEHWLNGVKVVEFDRTSESYRQHVAQSKFKSTRGFGEARQGHILLQDHGDAVWYRNIKIRELK
ncbi:MAG: 3-keto-disaccharide hydrolase [Blastocatellia bacterium]